MRGGGHQNFGVLTGLTYRVFQLPEVLAWNASWDAKADPQVRRQGRSTADLLVMGGRRRAACHHSRPFAEPSLLMPPLLLLLLPRMRRPLRRCCWRGRTGTWVRGRWS